MKKLLVLLICLGCSQANAQIGDFKLIDVINDDSLSLSDFSNAKGVAVIFTSNVCAFDDYYAARIKSLVETYAGKIQFLLINSNQGADESVERMKEVHIRREIKAPYLADKNQIALGRLDAKKTPEAFLLKPTAGKFIVFYSGALDDNPQVASEVREDYLKENIDELLAGQRASESARAVGCSIRKKQ